MYSVVSIGELGIARPERSFDRRTQALQYRDELNAKWIKSGARQLAVVVHPEVEEYIEWTEDDE